MQTRANDVCQNSTIPTEKQYVQILKSQQYTHPEHINGNCFLFNCYFEKNLLCSFETLRAIWYLIACGSITMALWTMSKTLWIMSTMFVNYVYNTKSIPREKKYKRFYLVLEGYQFLCIFLAWWVSSYRCFSFNLPN